MAYPSDISDWWYQFSGAMYGKGWTGTYSGASYRGNVWAHGYRNFSKVADIDMIQVESSTPFFSIAQYNTYNFTAYVSRYPAYTYITQGTRLNQSQYKECQLHFLSNFGTFNNNLRDIYSKFGVYWHEPSINSNITDRNTGYLSAAYDAYQGTIKYGASLAQNVQPTTWYDNDHISDFKPVETGTYYIWSKVDGDTGFDNVLPHVIGTSIVTIQSNVQVRINGHTYNVSYSDTNSILRPVKDLKYQN